MKSQTSTRQTVSNLDFYPTFLKVGGGRKPEGKILDETSLVPVFQRCFSIFFIYVQNGNQETGDIHFRARPGSVIEEGNWKLYKYFEDGCLRLYNMGAEVEENKNLKGIYSKK